MACTLLLASCVLTSTIALAIIFLQLQACVQFLSTISFFNKLGTNKTIIYMESGHHDVANLSMSRIIVNYVEVRVF